jgi:DNA-binding transcriptional LysR family regulator
LIVFITGGIVEFNFLRDPFVFLMAKPTHSTPRFTLRQLHYFVAAARNGQISEAAAEVNISQSAMTLAIAELEKVLGASLFDRGRHGVTLTYEGHAFLQQAEAVLQAAHEAARFPFHRRTDVSGRLELAATYTVQGYFLLPALARFSKLFPLVEVVPIEMPRADIEHKLLDGSLELAVLLLSNLDRPDLLNTQVLTRSRRQLWVASHHALADQGAVRWVDLARHPYILPMVDEGDSNAMRYWQASGLEPASWIRTSSMEALREMVALGLGVTILSDMVFRPWSLVGRRIQTLPVDALLPVMEVGLAWGRQRPLSDAAEAFREFLAMSVQQPATDEPIRVDRY